MVMQSKPFCWALSVRYSQAASLVPPENLALILKPRRQASESGKVGPQFLIRYVLACLPENSSQGAGGNVGSGL